MKKEWSTRHLFLSQPKRRTYISSECQAMKILWDQAVKFHSTAQKRCLDATTWVGPFRFSANETNPYKLLKPISQFSLPRPHETLMPTDRWKLFFSQASHLLFLFYGFYWDPHFSSFSLVKRCPQWCLNPTMPTDGWELFCSRASVLPSRPTVTAPPVPTMHSKRYTCQLFRASLF